MTLETYFLPSSIFLVLQISADTDKKRQEEVIRFRIYQRKHLYKCPLFLCLIESILGLARSAKLKNAWWDVGKSSLGQNGDVHFSLISERDNYDIIAGCRWFIYNDFEIGK